MKASEESAAKAREAYESLLELEELHMLYEEEVKHAELALEGMKEVTLETEEDEVDEYVSSQIQAALEGGLDTLDLSSQFLPRVPESFGRITSLVILNLANNRLEVRVRSTYEHCYAPNAPDSFVSCRLQCYFLCKMMTDQDMEKKRARVRR